MKTQKFDVDFEAEIMVEVSIEAVCAASRPAPFCQNPSSPAFSDDGDPGGIEEYTVFLTRKNKRGCLIKLDITDFIDSNEIEGMIDTESEKY